MSPCFVDALMTGHALLPEHPAEVRHEKSIYRACFLELIDLLSADCGRQCAGQCRERIRSDMAYCRLGLRHQRGGLGGQFDQ